MYPPFGGPPLRPLARRPQDPDPGPAESGAAEGAGVGRRPHLPQPPLPEPVHRAHGKAPRDGPPPWGRGGGLSPRDKRALFSRMILLVENVLKIHFSNSSQNISPPAPHIHLPYADLMALPMKTLLGSDQRNPAGPGIIQDPTSMVEHQRPPSCSVDPTGTRDLSPIAEPKP